MKGFGLDLPETGERTVPSKVLQRESFGGVCGK
jgi:hypothetical protein